MDVVCVCVCVGFAVPTVRTCGCESHLYPIFGRIRPQQFLSAHAHPGCHPLLGWPDWGQPVKMALPNWQA